MSLLLDKGSNFLTIEVRKRSIKDRTRLPTRLIYFIYKLTLKYEFHNNYLIQQ